MKLFAIGTKVRLIHTGDIGVVDGLLEHDLVSVRLSDGEVIPVMPEALERAEAYKEKVKAKVVPGKKKPEPLPIQQVMVDNQYTVLKPKGLQIAFDPIMKYEGPTDAYRIYLINDTRQNFLFNLRLSLQKKEIWKTQGRLGPQMMQETGSLRHQELNENAVVDLEIWRLLPEGKGTGGRLAKQLKIKPAQFFKKLVTAPYLNRACHLYLLFNPTELARKEASPKEKPRESLRSYTERQQPEQPQVWSNLQSIPHEVWEKAAFKNEIDLHIENLVEDPSGLSNKSILGVQLDHFEAYMRKAIQLGVERVFIIHGLGEGKLRTAIAKRLAQMPEVVSFKNEYHARYGYGATEVEL